MDNFIVSARKYRPATFVSVVGQQHITSTLKNAIARNQLAHAYLFCGPRGVGKTTCARIFAKAINCLDPKDNEACGQCESCRNFNDGRSFNIHELDAASNNSVDDIRALTEQVRIPPQIGRYSVYIIDEVHMLSASAFNAFLKTLEEPPAHAVFILATTEKHKIIPTILSRCQIYDFNRIRVEDSVEYLKYIAGQEGISYDDESLNLIARKADGGMRDALSMFDKAVAFCGNELRFKEVARTLNILDYDVYFTILDTINAGDYKSALRAFDEVLRAGFSGQTFVAGLNDHLRDLLLAKDPATLPLLESTGTLLERYKEQAARLDAAFLFDAIALLSAVDSGFKTATNQRLHVELGLMKLSGMGQKKNSLESETPPLPELRKKSDRSDTSNNESDSKSKEQNKPVSHAVVDPAGNPRIEVQTTAGISTETEQKKESTAPPRPEKAPEETPAEKPIEKTVAAETPDSDKKKAGKGVSGVKINAILKNGGNRATQGTATVQSPSRDETPDPEFDAKASAAKEEFIAAMERKRPRYATALNNMTLHGNTIRVTVGNELLKDDMVQHQKEILDLLRRLSGITGPIEMEVTVTEEKTAVRPIKPEDKLNHLRAKNPLVDTLRKELGLEIE